MEETEDTSVEDRSEAGGANNCDEERFDNRQILTASSDKDRFDNRRTPTGTAPVAATAAAAVDRLRDSDNNAPYKDCRRLPCDPEIESNNRFASKELSLQIDMVIRFQVKPSRSKSIKII